jgi:hypothetical protein
MMLQAVSAHNATQVSSISHAQPHQQLAVLAPSIAPYNYLGHPLDVIYSPLLSNSLSARKSNMKKVCAIRSTILDC